jgi:hypothetical protein
MKRFGMRFVWVFSALVLLLGSCHPTGPGTERWVYRLYDRNGSGASAAAVAFGGDGTAYVAGRTQSTIVVAALNSSGVEQWQYKFDTLATGALDVSCLTLGKDGNLYVAGKNENYGSTGPKFLVSSLTAAGVFRWTYLRADSSGLYGNGAASVVCGDDGNIYAAGALHGSFAVVSLTADGQLRWTYERANPNGITASASQVVWGTDGNLYVGGNPGDTTMAEIGVVSLTPAGSERWSYRLSSSTGWANGDAKLAQSADGNLYAVGSTTWIDSSDYASRIAVIGLTTDGQQRWVKFYRSGGNPYNGNSADALVCGSDQNVYLAFYPPGDSGYYTSRFSVLSLNSGGEENWRYSATKVLSYVNAPSILLGGEGSVYCSGSFDAGNEFGVISLTSSGALRWKYRFATGLFGSYSNARAIAWSNGTVCAVGDADGYNVGQYLLVVSLDAASGAD